MTVQRDVTQVQSWQYISQKYVSDIFLIFVMLTLNILNHLSHVFIM